MTLLAPVGLWFLLALPVIVILYLIRSRYRPRVVASLLLWKRMARDLEAEASWRRPRWDLLLALQLLVALLTAVALARPALSGGSGPRLVLVLDQSASMAARDIQPSRFAEAKQEVASIVASAPPDTRITLVSGGVRPRVVVDAGTPATVIGALNDLAPEALDMGDVANAARIAAGLAAPDATSGSQVVVVTDAALDLELDLPAQAVPVSFRLVGGAGQSLAVSEVSLRRPVDRIDYLAGFTRVVNFSSEPRDTTITILADSLPVDRAPLQVPASGHAEVSFHAPVGAQSVSVVLSERGPLVSSERVNLQGYGRWARRATIVSDAPAGWERVLAVVPDLTTRSLRPQDFAPSDARADEILLFDNVAPPDGLSSSAVILVNPPDPSPFLARVDSQPRQRQAERFDADADPLLRGLDIAPLTVQLQRAATPAWAAVSVEAEDTPLILHGRIGDRRAVIFTFDPNKSNLPRLAAFPLLMSNAIDWLVPGRAAVLHAGLGSATTSIQPRAVTDHSASTGLARAAIPSLSDVWPWFVAAAGLFFVLEWAVAIRRG